MEKDKMKMRVRLNTYLKLTKDGIIKSWSEFAKQEGLKFESFTRAALWCRL